MKRDINQFVIAEKKGSKATIIIDVKKSELTDHEVTNLLSHLATQAMEFIDK